LQRKEAIEQLLRMSKGREFQIVMYRLAQVAVKVMGRNA